MEQENQKKEVATLYEEIIQEFCRTPIKDQTITFGQGQVRILAYLCEHEDGVYSGDLSEAVQVGTGRIGNALKEMEKKGMITRVRDRKDHRKTIVRPTEKGIELAKAEKAKLTKLNDVIFDKLGYENFCSFLKTLKEIITISKELAYQEEVEK